MKHVHDRLVQTLKDWLQHYTNEQVLEEALDKHLPLDSFSDKEMIDSDDIQLVIKLLRIFK